MGLERRLRGGQAADHLREIADALRRRELGLLAAPRIAEVPQVQHLEAHWRVLGSVLGRLPPQPGVDLPRGSLAVADADGDGALGGNHVTTGEHARAPGHERGRHPDGAVALELHPGHRAQEGGVGVLAEGDDHRVRGQRLEPPGRLRETRLVELHHLDLQLLALKRLDRAQPVDAHALPLGVLCLLLVRRHLLPRAAVDDHRLLGAQSPRRARRVHRGVPAAVDGHPAADDRALAGRHAAQERDRVDDRPGVHGGNVHPL